MAGRRQSDLLSELKKRILSYIGEAQYQIIIDKNKNSSTFSEITEVRAPRLLTRFSKFATKSIGEDRVKRAQSLYNALIQLEKNQRESIRPNIILETVLNLIEGKGRSLRQIVYPILNTDSALHQDGEIIDAKSKALTPEESVTKVEHRLEAFEHLWKAKLEKDKSPVEIPLVTIRPKGDIGAG